MDSNKESNDYHYATHKGRGSNKTRTNRDSYNDVKSRKKEPAGSKSGTRQKAAVSSSSNSQSHSYNRDVISPTGGGSSRYHYREVPPRFQTHRYSNNNNKSSHHKSSHSTAKASTTQGNKKLSKDSNSQWGGSASHSSNDSWPTSPESDNKKSSNVKSKMDNNGWGEKDQVNLWSNNHWGSDEDSLSNSDPIPEDVASETTNKDKKMSSSQQDWEDLIDGPSSTNTRENLKLNKRDQEDKSSNERDNNSSPNHDSPDGDMSGIDGVWRSRNSIGSTSSVNSVGSNSSWKTASGNNSRMGTYQRSASPRKHSRHENHHHRSLSTSSNGARTPGRFNSKKKPIIDLDDAIENLQCEPSGWGDLPSPRQSEVDTGTEVWGIPDDLKQKMKHSDQNWNEPMKLSPQGASDWGDDGTMVAGWNHSGICENGISDVGQWAATSSSSTGWSTVVSKGKDRNSFKDKVKLLVDMGFPLQSCEKALQVNSDNIEAAIGDLLAIAAIKDEDQDMGRYSTTTTSNPLPMRSQTTPPSSDHSIVTQPLPIGHSPVATSNTTIPSNTSQTSAYQGGQVFWQQQQQSRITTANPPTNLDPNLQYIFNQQLNQLTQYRLMKHRLSLQLNQIQSAPGASSTTSQVQKQLAFNLNQVNEQIATVTKNLLAINQLMQQKQSMMQIDEKDGGVKVTGAAARLPPSSVEGNNEMPAINYSIQNMSMNSTSISKSSARTLSRLQQIINQQQSEQNESLDVKEPHDGGTINNNDQNIVGVAVSSSANNDNFSLPTSSSIGPTLQPQQAPPTSNVTTRFNSIRSVDDIPEFKPGVPWNPHSQGGVGPIRTTKDAMTPSTDFRGGPMYQQDIGNDLYSPNDYGQSYNNSQYPPSPANPRFEQPQHFGNNSQAHYSTLPIGGGSGSSSFNRSNSYSSNGSSYTNNGYYSSLYKPFNNLPQQKQSFVVPPPPPGSNRSHRPPKLQAQHSYGGVPTNSASYGPIGGRSPNNIYRSNSGQPQNKWNSFDGNPWGMPATSGSIWSMESSDSLLNTTASSFSEPWRATSNSSRKPSLPLKLNAPTHYILIKNISAQIDETSLREVCSEYGKVMTCLFNPFNETALIQYSTRDEVALAKVGLERNPSICGVYVQPHYATEHDIAMFTDRRTPSNPSLALSSALNMSGAPGPWFNDQSHRPHKPPAASLWGSNDDVAIGNTHSNNGGSSGSVWSNGGTTLPGIVSPWNVPRPSQPHHQDRDDSNAISTSPPLSTFLPNGLF